jgi:hypothetical protein
MKPATRPPLRSARLPDQLRERIRYRHYSLRTEQTYVYWVRAFVRHHGLRHPRKMGAAEVEAFLRHLVGGVNYLGLPRCVTQNVTRRVLLPRHSCYPTAASNEATWPSSANRHETNSWRR